MTITVTATVEPSTGADDPPRVRLNVAASAGETSTTVTRLNPDGSTVAVRTFDGLPQVITSGVAILYDYEMPYGVPLTYSTVENTASTSTVTVAESSIWLVHPGVPGLSMPVELRAGSLDEESYGITQGVFAPMGRANPIVVTAGSRQGAQSSLTVAVESATQLWALKQLVSDAGTLLLNIPTALGLLFDPCYIAVGEVRISRLSSIGSEVQRNAVLPFVVVDRPVGGSQAERTYVDLLDFPTYTALAAAYPTYTALMAGP
jgi:hypothetical protein